MYFFFLFKISYCILRVIQRSPICHTCFLVNEQCLYSRWRGVYLDNFRGSVKTVGGTKKEDIPLFHASQTSPNIFPKGGLVSNCSLRGEFLLQHYQFSHTPYKIIKLLPICYLCNERYKHPLNIKRNSQLRVLLLTLVF
jgi:hypothetical protein